MYDLPPRFFPEFFPEIILYQFVPAPLGAHLASQNFLKLFLKLAWDRLRRLHLTRLSIYMTDLIDVRDLQILLELGRTATYQVTNGPSFPAAIYLSARTKRWEIEEVELWLQSRKGLKLPVRHKNKPIKESDLFDGVHFVRVGA